MKGTMELPAGLVKIAEGREAEMFALDDQRVLRLYRGGFLRSSVEFQAQALEAARTAGIRVPAVYETMDVDGRVGVVMERIQGPDMLTLIGRQPWRVWWVGRVEGETHAAVGSAIASTTLPTTHERYERKITGSDRVPERFAEAALAALKALPEGDRLVHGDFHPGNLMMQDGQPVVIDWSNATRGVPETDFARSIFTTMMGDPPPGTAAIIRFFAKFARRLLLDSYVKSYRRHIEVDDALLAAWQLPVAVARIAEDIESERPKLIKYIDKLLTEA